MTDCIFCRIAAKTIPAKVVYEDERAIAFEDLSPQSPVHTLVIPKKHVATIMDVAPEDHGLVGHLFKVAATVAKEKGISERGFRLVMNTNAEGGQTVYHLHLHLLGGRAMHWPPG
jgi:histidine triad (HIT) family protein